MEGESDKVYFIPSEQACRSGMHDRRQKEAAAVPLNI